GFKRVYAPFNGIITRRLVDPGALINAGISGAAGKELFDIATTNPLRVYVNVPQAYSPAIHTGVAATVTLQEFPGQKFSAAVARTADAIDVTSRTLLTEVDVPNPDGKLLPGSFGEVHFQPHINANKVTIPQNAMLFRREGAQVAVVGPDGKVELRHITIGRDFGNTLEIVGGVDANDRVIVNPSDAIENGQKVNVAPQPQPGKQS
ncbi:MAG TPA: efflux RND transporter periplasmic adaptor subunit, partial [Bryocella sp.]|nr:efflux RND transporter periplasmic adaptor subunit [Bryocella sp.]